MNDADLEYLRSYFGIDTEWLSQEIYNRYIKILRPIIYEDMINFYG